jgi:long-chain acyl-CoA synthetase
MSLCVKPDYRELADLRDILTYSCPKYADLPAYSEKSKATGKYESVTFGQFREYTEAFGTALFGGLGLTGKRIAIISENRYQWMVSYLAVVCGGGVVVPIDRMLYPPADVANMLTKAECEAVIFSGSKQDMVLEIAPGLPFVKYLICMDVGGGGGGGDGGGGGGSDGAEGDSGGRSDSAGSDAGILSFWDLVDKGRELIASGERCFFDAKIDPEALAILLFTSGTTAVSKAVMLNHRNLATNVFAVSSVIDLREGDVTYSILPLHHTYECMVELMFLYNGASVAVCEGLLSVSDNLLEVRPTLLVTVPAFLERIIKRIVLALQKDGKQAIADMIINKPKLLAALP